MYLEDQDSSFYEEAIYKLHDRWNKYVNLQGDYVEKQVYQFDLGIFLRFRPRIFQSPLVLLLNKLTVK